MNNNMKCVMVMDEELPAGVAANTAALLGMTLGSRIEGAVGFDVVDQDGYTHLGILQIPLPILKANKEKIKELRTVLYEEGYEDITCVDFSDAAQCCHVYADWIEKIKGIPQGNLTYLGIGLYGDKKKVNRLCGSLPLYR